MAGIKFQCANIFDISTCKIPTNIIPDISENDKFEQITFASAMQIQTSKPNPIGFQCVRPSAIFVASQPGGMLGSIPIDENGCLIQHPDRLDYNYQYSGSDMFFGQTGTPFTSFQGFAWYAN